MNEALKELIPQLEQARKSADAVPWTPDTPHAQSIYSFDSDTQSWKATPSYQLTSPSPSPSPNSSTTAAITKLALFSWNIDFMLPYARARMEAGLSELERQITSLPASTASVIFLQECVPEDLETIGATPWVRRGFLRTDVDSSEWASRMYGTTTLVDKRVGVGGVFRVHYGLTRMERDGLFVDVVFPSLSQDKDKESGDGGSDGDEVGEKGGKKGGKNGRKIIRFCNTHLESLAVDPPYRPPQVALAAKFMHEESVHGALLAGDLNAIQPFDRTLHSANNLRDAYLELGGREDSEEGYTWGQQAPPQLREMYGCSRMDKVFYCGGVAVERFARFGADVEVEGEEEREAILKWGGFEKAWITDHLGVFAEVGVVD
ncbi:Endonuclease/exonuclease/phosphatase [Xylaria sp. FL0933]|nr:Endonuclease/exonuclease/phosphatase [Xylaria sp. FL0933]